ncbi:putative tyrosine-protein kinase in capsular polysaccharide biosynthesis region [Fulvivirga imtechensis AK7]|uniref:non-specific protein-tyrosine kinase n=1 Tax=Fulvivirga imtechensis AK7 TaxID=1237149 RepID=L8JW09_9BACT|nr:tyrosine-protein kinase [Fulvivirga imtechensis]ELR71784.1 putative tyrosine-protein kinase in capsular polysaccharide biosynthesis region [Fulvivirga imtechensis AK7]
MENKNIYSDTEKPTEGIDLDKALTVLRKSIPWILLIFIVTNLSAYLYIRWTKPLYESESELKLDVKSDASELGLLGLSENKNLNIISGEIELIKSKLFFSKVIETVDLDLSYYTAGQVLNDEKFKTSPFIVDYNLKNPQLLDRRIFVNIVDEKTYTINFSGDEQEKAMKYNFGEHANLPDIEFIIYLTNYFDPKGDKNFFFIINSKAAQIKYLGSNLTVEPLNLNANTIRIAFKDYNPLKARDLVNAIDTLYLKYSEEEKNLENKQKIEWLNSELRQIETQLEGYEHYFENFTIKNRTSDLNEDLKRTIETINALDSQRFQLTKRIQAFDQLLADLENNKTEFLGISQETYPKHIADAYNELSVQISERDKLRLSYNETTFALTRKEEEIKNSKTALKAQLEKLKTRDESEVRDLLVRRRRLEDNFVELPGKGTEYNKNQRFFKLYEEFYLSLMQSKAQFQIAEAGTTTEFKILSSATLPQRPISPNVIIIYGIGLVAGFIFSFIFVSVRYLLHNKISALKEIERLTTAPILGTVPTALEKIEATQLIIDKKPKSAVSEALRSIRTNIEFMVTGGKNQVISVTSTIGGEGKTFVAVNLGAIMALSKKKVLLLDLDMRKPRVHMAFQDASHAKGVSTILINKHGVDECIQKTVIENLDYIPAGPTPPNPSELLLNGEFDSLLRRLRLDYDVILLDTPPVGLVTDGILAMKKADLAIYIVRAHYSRKIFMNTLNRLIHINHFKKLAVVLNATSNTGADSYGYGYYEEKPEKSGNFIKRMINKGV